MKTAISIPDDLFQAAEDAARRRGMSRSRFFSEAVRLYLDRSGDADVTAQLDRVYLGFDGRVEPALLRAQARAIGREDW
ncbi:MAG: ChpI protein [Acidobacteria bacterium]|jgi:metal-responsive CopG/Arc/MetJ family transcriptional regulator|nr:ChpI protein [Acidobacteriota bacterium]